MNRDLLARSRVLLNTQFKAIANLGRWNKLDIKAYMMENLNFIDGLVQELEKNTKRWSSDKVLEKSGDMIEAFHKRFSLEDFLLRHVSPSKEMQIALSGFLK